MRLYAADGSLQFFDSGGEALYALFDLLRLCEGEAGAHIVEPLALSRVEGGAGDEGDAVIYRLHEELGRIDARYLKPEEESALRRMVAGVGRQVFFEGGVHSVAFLAVMGDDLRQEAVEVSKAAVFIDEGLRDDARAEVGPLLDHHHLLDQLGRADDPRHARAGRQYLGEGAGIDDAPALIHREDGRHMLSVVAEVSVGIVLEDDEVVFLGDLEQLCAALFGERRSRRVLEVDDRIDEFYIMSVFAPLLDDLRQQVDAESVLVAWHGEEARAAVAHRVQRPRVRGALDDDRIAVVEQHGTEKVHPLLRTGGDQHLVGFCLTAHAGGHPLCDIFLERFIAVRGAVLQNVLALARQYLRGLGELRDGEDRRVGVPAGKRDDAGRLCVLKKRAYRRRLYI